MHMKLCQRVPSRQFEKECHDDLVVGGGEKAFKDRNSTLCL